MGDRESEENGFHLSLPKEIWWGDEHLYQLEGFWFRLPYLQGIRNVVNSFEPLPSDVILTSFPKTGTTWLKALLYATINHEQRGMLETEHPHELVPLLELTLYKGKEGVLPSNVPDSSPSPRIFQTHIPYELLAKKFESSGCRIVHVTRNPKDTLVSLWHFVCKSPKFAESADLNVLVEKFCSGVVSYGCYYDHVLGYWKQSKARPEKVFFVTYEQLKDDSKTHVKSLASFLGCKFEDGKEDEVVEDIIRLCSFKDLTTKEPNKSNETPEWFGLPYNSFYRKGEVGDHKNLLTPEMIEKIDKVTAEKFHKEGLMMSI